MKKKLVLITLDPVSKEKYIKDLRDFFEDWIEIEGYCIREGINGPITGDLALITSPILTDFLKSYLSVDMEIIYVTRTILKSSYERLKKLPTGAKAMLVSNSSIFALDMISLLYKIGIKHINFIPVFPDMQDIPDIDIAVTPGQTFYVPSRIKSIIDIGWRVYDISTLMNIITKLKIKNKQLLGKIAIYSQKIIPTDYGMHSTLDSISQMEEELNIILNEVDDGIIVTDTSLKITHYNKSVIKILNLNPKDIYSKKIDEGILSKSLHQVINEKKGVENLFVKIPEINKKLIVTKRHLKVHNNILGYVIIIKDITEIQNLESYLRKQLIDKGHIAKYTFRDISGNSKLFLACIHKAKKIAMIDKPVLILGESGTGKELFAQSIHNASTRKNKPFVAINCATLPSDLLESEMFGYEEGAFTGARKGGKKGLFEMAHTGAIFLDEIGEMPINLQAKLLRVLQEKEVRPVGSNNIIPIDVRIIAATNKNLKNLIDEGKFRMDLYYRLNVFSLHLPPLRERKKDILYLVKDILAEMGHRNRVLDEELINLLSNYSWKGNVRELRNCIEYMIYMGGERLNKYDLPDDIKKEVLKGEENLDFQLGLFSELPSGDRKIAMYILDILKTKNAGRRRIHHDVVENGFEISEYDIRKIMDFLHKQGMIAYGEGRSGAQLTPKAKEIIL